MRDRYKICLIATLISTIELGYIPNTKPGFICKDPKISHPFSGDSVSTTTLIFSTFLGSLFVITLIEILREKSFKRVCKRTIWSYYKECFLGTMAVLLTTTITKIMVGEHRPHFFYSCEPDANRDCQPGAFISSYNCTNTRVSEYFKTESTRSFPSAHSSVSVFVAIYLSYLIHMRISTVKLAKLVLISMCLVWSLLCSLTRITDRRHHWWDVLGGTLFGAIGAVSTVVLVHEREQQKLKN